ncbi:RHS repeat domain-containing protein [Treponema sp. R6D11]
MIRNNRARPERKNSLFSYIAVIMCAAFIMVFAGCPNPDDSGSEPAETPKPALKKTPVADDFFVGGLEYAFDGSAKSATITPKAGKSDGDITVYYNGAADEPVVVGIYEVTFDIAAKANWNEATSLDAGTMTIYNSSEHVILLAKDTLSDGFIAGETGEQWFIFTATDTTQYIHFVAGNLWNVSIQLLDSNGNVIEEQINTANSNHFSHALTNGADYYIKVKPVTGSGSYRLGFNASEEQPVKMAFPALGVTSLYVDTWADGNIPTRYGVQWFKFTATDTTQFIHFSSGTLTFITVQLYDNTGTAVGVQTAFTGSLSALRTLVSGNEYYIRAVQNSAYNEGGTYKIGFTASGNQPSKIILPTAIRLSADTWTNGSIAGSNDKQWYTFTATASIQFIHFSPGTLSGVTVQVYDNTGTAVGGQASINSNSDGNNFISRTLVSGNEYFFSLTHSYSSGTYMIGYNDSVVPIGKTAARLGYNTWADSSNVNLPVNQYSYVEQWFVFTATASTQYIHFSPGTLSSVSIYLYDTSGAAVSGTGSTPYTSWTVTAGTDYYIKIRSSGSSRGTYRLLFNESPLSSNTNAAALNANIWTDVLTSSEKWYTFTATASTQYIHFNPGTLTGVDVELYDSNGVIVGGKTSLSGSTLYTSRTVTAGTDYFIRITNNSYGSYKIGFNELFIPPPVTTVSTLIYDMWAAGDIPAAGAVQWFKFTAKDANQYIHFSPGTLQLNSLNNVRVILYTTDGIAVEYYGKIFSGSGYYTNLYLTSGSEYYVKLEPSSGAGSGTYKIGFNASTSQPSTVTLPTNVPQLSADTWADGAIAGLSDFQWFKFTATSATQYIHFTPGTLSGVSVQLYDTSGAAGGRDSLSGDNLYTAQTLTAGTEYYIRISSGSAGAYKIMFNTSPISSNTIITRLGDNTWANVTGSGNEQWFKFTATASTQFIHFDMGNISIDIQLYDTALRAVGGKTSLSYKGYITRTLTSGTEYYIQVRRYGGSGAYKIGFNAAVVPPEATAVRLNANTWTNGDYGQWFKFTATAALQYIHFDRGTSSNASIDLYDSAGNRRSWVALSGSTRYITTPLTIDDDYYIQVSTVGGAYRVSFNASFIPPNTTITQMSEDAWFTGDIAASNGEQWFRFTATTATHYLHFESGTLSGAEVQLFDTSESAAGSQINFSGGVLYVSRTLTTGNEYYVRLIPADGLAGTYKIAFNRLFLPPNTTITALGADIWSIGSITATGGAQWFKFTATAATQFIHLNPGNLASVYVQLYDSTGTPAGEQTMLYGSALYTSRTVTSGSEYYIKVTSYSGTGAYKIGFNKIFIPPETTITALNANIWAEDRFGINETHWFKLTSMGNNQYIHFNPGTLTSVYVQLYDSTGVAVGSQTRLYSGALNAYGVVTINTEYYLSVTPYNNGSGVYRIGTSTSSSSSALSGAYLPTSGVTTLSTGTWNDGAVSGVYKEQWFKFTATASVQYIYFNTGTIIKANVQLYTAAGSTVGNQTELNAITSNTSFFPLTNGDEYYIRVSNSVNGTYKIGLF